MRAMSPMLAPSKPNLGISCRRRLEFGVVSKFFVAASAGSRCAIDRNHCLGPRKGSAPKVRRGVHIAQNVPQLARSSSFFAEKMALHPRKLARADVRLWSFASYQPRAADFRSYSMTVHQWCNEVCLIPRIQGNVGGIAIQNFGPLISARGPSLSHISHSVSSHITKQGKD